jgi:hypothetical protein
MYHVCYNLILLYQMVFIGINFSVFLINYEKIHNEN